MSTEATAHVFDEHKSSMSDFAGSLHTARILWRRYPQLVENEGFPEEFRAAHLEFGSDRDPAPTFDDTNFGDFELQESGVLPEANEQRRAVSFEAVRENVREVFRESVSHTFDEHIDRGTTEDLVLLQRSFHSGQS